MYEKNAGNCCSHLGPESLPGVLIQQMNNDEQHFLSTNLDTQGCPSHLDIFLPDLITALLVLRHTSLKPTDAKSYIGERSPSYLCQCMFKGELCVLGQTQRVMASM